MEIQVYLREYEEINGKLEDVMNFIEELCKETPYTQNLLEIDGIGIKTVSGFLAEVGDLRRFNDPKQIQKLAGLALKENSSGKHKGETTLSKRGRKRLRYLLFEASMSLVAKNEEFCEIHKYYTNRENNPLKKMQSLMAIANKLIRVFYTILTKGIKYDGEKMLKDIIRPTETVVA
jgi:transposase